MTEEVAERTLIGRLSEGARDFFTCHQGRVAGVWGDLSASCQQSGFLFLLKTVVLYLKVSSTAKERNERDWAPL